MFVVLVAPTVLVVGRSFRLVCFCFDLFDESFFSLVFAITVVLPESNFDVVFGLVAFSFSGDDLLIGFALLWEGDTDAID